MDKTFPFWTWRNGLKLLQIYQNQTKTHLSEYMNCLVSVIDIRFSSKSTVPFWYLHLGPNFTNQQLLESIKPSDLFFFARSWRRACMFVGEKEKQPDKADN